MDARAKRLEQMLAESSSSKPFGPPESSLVVQSKHSKRQFLAAAGGRLNSDWPSVNLSSDEEFFRELRILRGRSRWLAKNNGYYRRYLDMCVDNIVGPNGVRLEAKIKKANGEQDKGANDVIEDAWRSWSKKGIPMRRSQWTRVDMERSAVWSVARDGEVFFRKWYGSGEYGFQLEMIDAMRVPTEMNIVQGNGIEVINGIEYTDGDVTGYYIARRGMRQDFTSENYERVDAKFILHLFVPLFAEQKRGFPWLSAGMSRIHQLDRYENAEIIASRIAAEKGGFFKRTAAADTGFSGDGSEEESEIQYMDSEAGSFGILPEGYDFAPWDPTHPTNAFESLSNKLLKGIASAGNVNYTSLANDLSEVNYSSARIGMLEVRDFWKGRQNWLVNWFHDAVYAEWLPMAMSSGKIRLPFSRINEFMRVSWVPRSWAWVDPQKEANANKANLLMRVTSLSDIAASQGDEIEDVFDRLAKEKQMADAAGIDMTEIFGPFKPAQQVPTVPGAKSHQRPMNGHKLNGYEHAEH
jgi:lambda family phage portal protein